MKFEPGAVSLEEYNQSLRDSVNAYYEHAINDPSMSRQEAIDSTAQMSENYLGAVEEFEQNMDREAENELSEDGTDPCGPDGLDEGGLDEDGLDDGMDP